jgi:hypothetical protein
MGRSVSYPRDAVVTFGTFEGEDEWDWRDLISDFRSEVKRLFPSATNCDEWIGGGRSEDHAVMENGHAYFGVSEYCGMVSYWVVAKPDYYGDISPLAEAWIAKIAPRFTNSFGTLRKVGVFSNGGGVYEPISSHDPGPDQFETKPYVISGMVTDG